MSVIRLGDVFWMSRTCVRQFQPTFALCSAILNLKKKTSIMSSLRIEKHSLAVKAILLNSLRNAQGSQLTTL